MRVHYRAVLSITLLILAASSQAQQQPQEQLQPLPITRIYADENGASHFGDAELALALVHPGPGIPPTPASVASAATGLLFLCPPSGGFADWHAAPHRQYNVMLSGEVEVEVSDGEKRRFGPGSLLLLEDTRGQGVRTRVVSQERACFVGVALDER